MVTVLHTVYVSTSTYALWSCQLCNITLRFQDESGNCSSPQMNDTCVRLNRLQNYKCSKTGFLFIRELGKFPE